MLVTGEALASFKVSISQFKSNRELATERNNELKMVVGIERFVTSDATSGRHTVDQDRYWHRRSLPGTLVLNADIEPTMPVWNLFRILRVARGDVDRSNGFILRPPDHRKVDWRLSPGRRVDRMARIVDLGGAGPPGEPPLIEIIARWFSPTGVFPFAAVPDFDPTVIAAFVGPERRSHETSRNPNRAAGLDQQHA